MNIARQLGLLVALSLPAPASARLRAPRPRQAGDIPFAAGIDVSGGTVSGVTQSAIGDLDADGLPDIGVFEGGLHAGGRRTFAWFEAPNGARHEFNPSLQPGPFVGAAAFADIDRDGRLDVVVSSDLHSGGARVGSLYWYRNPGGTATGDWSRHTIAQDLSDTEHINDIAIADMDRDGKLDVVIRHLGATLKVRIFFQDTLDLWTVRTLPVRAREGLGVADLDRDGRLDIVLNGFWWAAPVDPRTGSFGEHSIDSAYHTLPESGLNNSVKIGVGDLDRDGRDDVLFSVAEGAPVQLAWFRCPLDPRTQPWTKTVIEDSFTNGHQAQLGDMDRDGDLDLVDGLSFGSAGVFVYRNGGNGSAWTKQTLTTSLGMYSGVIGDIGADGDLDIVGGDTYANAGRPWLYENTSLPVQAKATVRNGSGVNPSCFASSSPVLGSQWTATVDTTGHSGTRSTTVFGYARSSAGNATPYGELLVDGGSARVFWSSAVPAANGIASYTYSVPPELTMVGVTATVQAVILGGGPELCNAIDLVLGF
jgi:hypothetical protein